LRKELVQDYGGDLRQFVKIIRDAPINTLSHDVMNECKQKLMRLPANLNKDPKLRNRTVEEVLALTLEPQAAYTARKKWSRLEQFLSWAVSHGPSRAQLRCWQKAQGEGKPTNDLKALFEGPHFREHQYGEAFEYWLPVLGLYTGARLEESRSFTWQTCRTSRREFSSSARVTAAIAPANDRFRSQTVRRRFIVSDKCRCWNGQQEEVRVSSR